MKFARTSSVSNAYTTYFIFGLFGETITSSLSVIHKIFFTIPLVSNDALAVRAITGILGPASDRSSPSFPYPGRNAGFFCYW